MSNNPKYANEYLDLIEKATGDDKLKLLKDFGARPPLNYLLSMNYNKEVSFELPPGMPPYKRDEATHGDLFPPLATMIQRLKNCFPTALQGISPNLRKTKKQQIFIEIMESISPKEGDILVHCKDRALTEIYPTITAELVKSVFPAYVK